MFDDSCLYPLLSYDLPQEEVPPILSELEEWIILSPEDSDILPLFNELDINL